MIVGVMLVFVSHAVCTSNYSPVNTRGCYISWYLGHVQDEISDLPEERIGRSILREIEY